MDFVGKLETGHADFGKTCNAPLPANRQVLPTAFSVGFLSVAWSCPADDQDHRQWSAAR